MATKNGSNNNNTSKATGAEEELNNWEKPEVMEASLAALQAKIKANPSTRTGSNENGNGRAGFGNGRASAGNENNTKVKTKSEIIRFPRNEDIVTSLGNGESDRMFREFPERDANRTLKFQKLNARKRSKKQGKPKEIYKDDDFCTDDFGPLADKLNGYLVTPGVPVLLAQLYRCIAERILANQRRGGQGNTAGDLAHIGVIIGLINLYKYLDDIQTEGMEDIVSISFVKYSSAYYPFGHFIVTTKEKPAQQSSSTTTTYPGAGDGSAWNSPPKGGKRKTRKARKSSRKQTRRK